MATAAISQANTNKLDAQMEHFRVQIPGGESPIAFCDDEEMRRQMENHYGDWKKPGTVTPIPLARIPRVFLHDQQMPTFFKKQFQPIQKGETGEIQVLLRQC